MVIGTEEKILANEAVFNKYWFVCKPYWMKWEEITWGKMPTLKDQSMCTSGFKLRCPLLFYEARDKPFPSGCVEGPVWILCSVGRAQAQTQRLVFPATSLAQEPVFCWLWVSPELRVVSSLHYYACVKLLIKISSKHWLDRRQMYSNHLNFPWNWFFHGKILNFIEVQW